MQFLLPISWLNTKYHARSTYKKLKCSRGHSQSHHCVHITLVHELGKSEIENRFERSNANWDRYQMIDLNKFEHFPECSTFGQYHVGIYDRIAVNRGRSLRILGGPPNVLRPGRPETPFAALSDKYFCQKRFGKMIVISRLFYFHFSLFSPQKVVGQCLCAFVKGLSIYEGPTH